LRAPSVVDWFARDDVRASERVDECAELPRAAVGLDAGGGVAPGHTVEKQPREILALSSHAEIGARHPASADFRSLVTEDDVIRSAVRFELG
jgi:hypothetical protein